MHQCRLHNIASLLFLCIELAPFMEDKMMQTCSAHIMLVYDKAFGIWYLKYQLVSKQKHLK